MNDQPMYMDEFCSCCGYETKHIVKFISYKLHFVTFELYCEKCIREAKLLNEERIRGWRITISATDWIGMIPENLN